MNKLIRLTIQVDIEPESANLGEAIDYLKGLKGAERVELVDLEVVKDPRAEEKLQRQSLDRSFGAEETELPPLPKPGDDAGGNNGDQAIPEKSRPEDPARQQSEKPEKVLDRIKLR